MNRNRTLLSLAFAAFLSTGCSGGNSTVSEATSAKVAGHWQYQSGPLLNGAQLGTVTWLDADKSGAATILAKAPLHGTIGCASAVIAVLNDTVLSLQTPTVFGNVGNTTYFLYAVTADTLTLTDADQNVTTFKKAASIPAADQCTALTSSAVITIPAASQATTRTSLGSDGTRLWWTNAAEDSWVPFNPVTSSAGALAPAGNYRFVIAMQGSDFWDDCFCGGGNDLERFTSAGVLVDSFDTQVAPISHYIDIRAGTWDGSRLWIAGNDDANQSAILKVNSDAEPDTLDSFITTDGDVTGVAFVGTKLYVTTYFLGPVLVELDPATGDALTTWRFPANFPDVYGLAAIGTKLYALAQGNDNLFALVELDI
ncbi:MAG TPA: hypothetical protein VMV18_02815 [bacterium]|nr:hypothetical protein [bacterium]